MRAMFPEFAEGAEGRAYIIALIYRSIALQLQAKLNVFSNTTNPTQRTIDLIDPIFDITGESLYLIGRYYDRADINEDEINQLTDTALNEMLAVKPQRKVQ